VRRSLLASAVILLAAPAAAGAQVRPPGLEEPIGNEVLSDERMITRWATPVESARIRVAPRKSARAFAKLRFATENGLPEVYLVLRGYVDPKGIRWVQIRVPGRPNGRKGWVHVDHLDDLRLVRTKLHIDRKKLRATLYHSGKQIWTSRVGIGKRGAATPAGRFWVRERIRNLAGSPIYGPWAFGTSAYSNLSDWPGGGVVGIHGTNQPGLIPGRISHGCVRVPNPNVRRLAKLMPIGTPIRIV
jgi:hypothetical protein